MDLQGIGALAAAAVAALGIPAAVLVGRWQLRAALRGAEVASQAGLAQAEATYRAALDQAAAQNSAAYDQWRRGIRRDAWSAFLLSVEDVVKSSKAGFSGADVDLAPGLRSVQTAFVVLELEGPPPMVAAAQRLVQRCNDLCELCEGDRPAARAWQELSAAVEQERARSADDDAGHAQRAWSALERLTLLANRARSVTSEPAPVSGPPDDDALHTAYRDLEAAHSAVVAALAECALPTSQVQLLLRDASHDGRHELASEAGDILRFLRQDREVFLQAAREYLDTAG